MIHRMYSIVHLSKIIRLSAFKSPLFHPSSYELVLRCFVDLARSGVDLHFKSQKGYVGNKYI
jgi:hypothetical protein